ncbi:class F sortase [Nonomuraea harbinensis]|uniref:Class F sortase n=1 Tax=Nonomuraea harbinensis TaxID=1286938 RepID=A0ABW1BYN9_9ACTN|nr:class F sortase [Nonomuraea harbinensis]
MRRRSLALVAGALVATVACAPAAPRAAAAPQVAGALDGAVVPQAASVTVEAANPVRLRIPSIGVSTKVIPLKLDKAGRLIAPEPFDRVGWHEGGPEPGERGVAVIAGHVDSRTGPAVFFRLRDLRKGARVHVDRADGSTVTFTVSRLARYPKDRVPDEVYNSGEGAQLRLITCGGTFDRARRSYRDNVVVFAR